MTEAKLDLQPSWPYLTSLVKECTVFIVWRGLCTISGKKLYTDLAMLGGTSSIAEFDKVYVCTQFEEKPAVPRYVVQDTWYCLHQLQSATRSVHNSRKTQLDIYKACKSSLHISTYCNSAHNSRKTVIH